MCGILGGINASFDEAALEKLHHRGPDQRDLHTFEVEGVGAVQIGQTRLNIVDRHDVTLPIRVRDAVITFNGEIYNWPELRDELSALGWTFNTKTDTEVVLAAYLQWGVECLERFNGMFAFAIWDGQRFFCARDRMGKKPFFYRVGQRSFEFASEVKALPDLRFVSQEISDLFEFCHNDITLYENIFSLPPASYLLYDPFAGTYVTRSYWDVEHRVDRKITDPKQAIDGLIELLTDAVNVRLRADVPISLFLSGGLDSSIIAKLAGTQEAFTCQFEEFKGQIDEEHYAKDLAKRLGIALTVVRPTKQEFLADLPALAHHLEMPTGSFSVFPLYRLAKAAHDAGYKVILSGEGSDELFAGYARNEFLLGDDRGDNPKMRSYGAMLRRYDGSDLDRFCRMASRSGLMGAALMRTYLAQHWSDRKTMLENMSYVESRIFIQPLLQMADRMCMAHSVEGRCPFLDHRVVEYAFSLDDSLRYRDGVGKWIVHEVAKRILPKGALVLERGEKHGLPTPVNLWMQGRHSFDRKYWNAMLTAECIRALLG